MPKRVDHDERRRHIAAAVWTIAADQGLEAVSMRAVASAATVSTALVQHYFSTKARLLAFSLAELTRQAQVRAEQRVSVAAGDPAAPGHLRALVRATLAEYLPLDAGRRTLLLVHLAFFARALRDPEIASIFRDDTGGLTGFLAGVLGTGRAASTGSDPTREADTLLTLAVGLGTDMLIGSRTGEQALDLLDYHLDRLLGPDEANRA